MLSYTYTKWYQLASKPQLKAYALADNNVLSENWISSQARWKGRIKWNPLILFQALQTWMWNKTLHTNLRNWMENVRKVTRRRSLKENCQTLYSSSQSTLWSMILRVPQKCGSSILNPHPKVLYIYIYIYNWNTRAECLCSNSADSLKPPEICEPPNRENPLWPPQKDT